MPVCARCGSVNTREVRRKPIARLIALALRQRAIFCNRCGWEGRVRPDRPASSTGSRHASRSAHGMPRGVAPADAPPDLAALDRSLERKAD